jgi:hypothetical protein
VVLDGKSRRVRGFWRWAMGGGAPVLLMVCVCGAAGDHYIARVSGLGDGASAVASFGAGGVPWVAAGGWGTAAGCFFWALVAAALRAAAFAAAARRMRVFAAFCPAARCFRVATAFLAAARRLRVRAAFAAAVRRFAAFRLRVVAAFFPALFRLGIISSSVAIREGLDLKLLVYARPALWLMVCCLASG